MDVGDLNNNSSIDKKNRLDALSLFGSKPKTNSTTVYHYHLPGLIGVIANNDKYNNCSRTEVWIR